MKRLFFKSQSNKDQNERGAKIWSYIKKQKSTQKHTEKHSNVHTYAHSADSPAKCSDAFFEIITIEFCRRILMKTFTVLYFFPRKNIFMSTRKRKGRREKGLYFDFSTKY